LSYRPAFFAGVKDRGFLREGAPADIIVYDLENLEVMPLETVHDFPGGEWRRVQRSKGYRWIMVNGQVTFEDGKPTGELPGKLLRHGRG
jgi:N-acyl-D-aspartate/D-glutamate deacylase